MPPPYGLERGAWGRDSGQEAVVSEADWGVQTVAVRTARGVQGNGLSGCRVSRRTWTEKRFVGEQLFEPEGGRVEQRLRGIWNQSTGAFQN